MTPDKILLRAQMYLNPSFEIHYRMGGGTIDPKSPAPWSMSKNERILDCSGFALWCMGLSRQPLKGYWLNTDTIAADINGLQKYFTKIESPQPGCIVVDGAGTAVGHCAIVLSGTTLDNLMVIDCSSKGQLHSITRNHGFWFRRPGNKTVFGTVNEPNKT